MGDPHRNTGSEVTRRSFLARAGLTAAGLAAAGTLVGVLASTKSASGATWRVPKEDSPLARMWMAWPSNVNIWGTRLLRGIQTDIATLAKEVAKHTPVIMCATDPSAATTARGMCGPTVTVISSIPVDDCWMRDTGPLFRIDGVGGRDAFGLNFNGWGNEQAHVKDVLVAGRIAAYAGVSPFTSASIVGEGGAVEYDGDGTLMATESSLVNANRNPGKTKAQVEAELLSKYGATKMIWFPGLVGKDITDDHIDGTARFVRPGVVINQLSPPGRTDIWAQDERQIDLILRSSTDAKGRQLQLYTVYGPDSLPRVPRDKRRSFFDGYVNFCIAGDAVITAQFGDAEKDAAAKATIEAAFPGKTCVQLDLDHLHGDGGGGAHCVTMQEPLP